MKKNDIIKLETSTGVVCTAKVNWVLDKEAGITYMTPDSHKGGASIVLVNECTVIIEWKGDEEEEVRHNMTVEELKENIERLRGMRFPKKMAIRTQSRTPKPKSIEKQILLMDDDTLNALIEKALKDTK